MKPKSVLITGCAKRIGHAIALAFASENWTVFVHCHRSADEAAELASVVNNMGARSFVIQRPLDTVEDVEAVLQCCADKDGLPDCIVNNAAIFAYDSGLKIDEAIFEKTMRTNLLVPVAFAQCLHERLPENAHGACVINLLDQKIANLNPDYLSYTLAKCALHAAIDMLAKSLAPKIRVVGLAPGLSLPSGEQTQAEFEKAHRVTPLGKSSSPEDIAQAALFLASSQSITGTTLFVDGGQHLIPLARDVMFLAK